LTVIVHDGDAGFWTGLGRVRLGRGETNAGRDYDVERSRAYRDRLVLKLRGVDDADAAAGLRGARVEVEPDRAPALQEGEHFVACLVGMEVRDEGGRSLGRVGGTMPTAGVDLLVVERDAGPGAAEGEQQEIWIPMAAEIVLEIDEEGRTITVRPPDGLLELNASESETER
jgi:16S rRNA processing protein RimM